MIGCTLLYPASSERPHRHGQVALTISKEAVTAYGNGAIQKAASNGHLDMVRPQTHAWAGRSAWERARQPQSTATTTIIMIITIIIIITTKQLANQEGSGGFARDEVCALCAAGPARTHPGRQGPIHGDAPLEADGCPSRRHCQGQAQGHARVPTSTGNCLKQRSPVVVRVAISARVGGQQWPDPSC